MPVAEKRKRSRRPRRPRQTNMEEAVRVLYEAPPQGEDEENVVEENVVDYVYDDDVYDDDVYDDDTRPPIASFLSSREALTAAGAIGALVVGWLVYRSLSNKNNNGGQDPGDPLDPPVVNPSRKIVLDPWGEGNAAGLDHAGRAGTCLSVGLIPRSYTGATANLFVANAVGKYLKRVGYPFEYTRKGDEEMSLTKKASKIAKEKPVILIAVRHSNFVNNCPTGSTVIYPSGPSDISMRSKQLAELIRDNLQFRTTLPPFYQNTVRFVMAENEADGSEEEYFRLLRQTGPAMPVSVIVDPSPLCNCMWQAEFKKTYWNDRGLKRDDFYVSLLGNAIANAIRQYFNMNA